MDVSLVHASRQPSNRVSMSVGSSGYRPLRASEARAERRAAQLAAGEFPRARRGRRGGQWQQYVQLNIHIDRVDHFHAAPARTRSHSRGRSRGSGGTIAPMRAVAGAPQQAVPLNAFVPRAAREASPAPLVAPRRALAPLTPPLAPPSPPPGMAPAAPCPAPPIAWPERVLQVFSLGRCVSGRLRALDVEVR